MKKTLSGSGRLTTALCHPKAWMVFWTVAQNVFKEDSIPSRLDRPGRSPSASSGGGWAGPAPSEEKVRISTGQFQDPGPVCLLVGPEGGFHQEELAWARANGFTSVSLGSLTLRAETATIAAVAVVQFLLDSLVEQT